MGVYLLSLAAWRQSRCTPHIFGLLPGRHGQATQPNIDSEPEAHP